MPYKPGDYWVQCDICGLKKYASECRMTWNNLFVCADTCFEPKHPQYREPTGLHERQSVEINRPRSEDKFLEYGEACADDL